MCITVSCRYKNLYSLMSNTSGSYWTQCSKNLKKKYQVFMYSSSKINYISSKSRAALKGSTKKRKKELFLVKPFFVRALYCIYLFTYLQYAYIIEHLGGCKIYWKCKMPKYLHLGNLLFVYVRIIHCGKRICILYNAQKILLYKNS